MIKTLGIRRYPHVGRIALGVQETNAAGASYPKNVDYFVIPEELIPVVGARPKVLPVMFPANEPERVLDAWMEKYEGGGAAKRGVLTVRCDGERMTQIPRDGGAVEERECQRVLDPETGYPVGPCACGATATARLSVMIVGGPIGVYRLTMGSEKQIAALLFDLRLFYRTFGSLTTINGHPIPFELVRQPETLSVIVKEKRIAREWWPVRLRCGISNTRAMALGGVKMLEAAEGGSGDPVQVPEADAQDLDQQHDGGQGAMDFDEWDAPRCIAAAVALGVTGTLYERYLVARYGRDKDSLTPADLQKERTRLEGVEALTEGAKRLVRDIVETVNRSLSKKGGA